MVYYKFIRASLMQNAKLKSQIDKMAL